MTILVAASPDAMNPTVHVTHIAFLDRPRKEFSLNFAIRFLRDFARRFLLGELTLDQFPLLTEFCVRQNRGRSVVSLVCLVGELGGQREVFFLLRFREFWTTSLVLFFCRFKLEWL